MERALAIAEIRHSICSHYEPEGDRKTLFHLALTAKFFFDPAISCLYESTTLAKVFHAFPAEFRNSYSNEVLVSQQNSTPCRVLVLGYNGLSLGTTCGIHRQCLEQIQPLHQQSETTTT